jgi:hypothetical protein
MTTITRFPSSTGPPRNSGRPERSRPGGRRGRGWTLAVVSVAPFMLMLDITVVNVALPEIRRVRGMTPRITPEGWTGMHGTLPLVLVLARPLAISGMGAAAASRA